MNSTTTLANQPAATIQAGSAWPWLADLGHGRYRNPILHADYSDPDVTRAGDDFWMTASSFNCTPGLPILHSRDLVNWRLVNYALKNLPHPRYDQVQPGCGVWAPSIRYHAGKFWIFFPTPDEGFYLTTATDPAGDWSEPHLVQAGKGLIDPCPLWDDDGQAYLVHAYAGSRAGIKHRVRVCPMAPDGSRLLGEGQIVFHEPERHPTLEGPKFMKRDGWYYILAPAGGVATGWQIALRSRHIYGPYEDKILLAQGRTPINGPHQGALVDTPAGEWWFLHFQDAGLYGRILHLQPVRWADGWPLMGVPGPDGIGDPVLEFDKPALPTARPESLATSDEFTSSNLALQWQWHANHRDDWHSLTARPGWLRLFAQPAADRLENTPNLLLQKFPAHSFAVETCVELDGADNVEAGLLIAGRSSAAIAVIKSGPRQQLVLRMDTNVMMLAETASRSIRLRVWVAEGGGCEFAYAEDGGQFIPASQTFQAQPGVWIGAKVGLYAVTDAPSGKSWADFDYFQFQAG
jgi:beta-xylosidase